jgi:DNA-binding transcriptional ArsR family regulator
MNAFKILDRDEIGALSTPLRRELIEALEEPGSATSLARRFDMSRQRIGYHMRELEKAGCIELAGERPRRGLTERLYKARPLAYVRGEAAPDRRLAERDRFSWAALVNGLAQALWELVTLRRRADAAGKRLATLTLEAELRFSSPTERKAFTEDLIDAVETVLTRHDNPDGARRFRMILGAYPALTEEETP